MRLPELANTLSTNLDPTAQLSAAAGRLTVALLMGSCPCRCCTLPPGLPQMRDSSMDPPPLESCAHPHMHTPPQSNKSKTNTPVCCRWPPTTALACWRPCHASTTLCAHTPMRTQPHSNQNQHTCLLLAACKCLCSLALLPCPCCALLLGMPQALLCAAPPLESCAHPPMPCPHLGPHQHTCQLLLAACMCPCLLALLPRRCCALLPGLPQALLCAAAAPAQCPCCARALLEAAARHINKINGDNTAHKQFCYTQLQLPGNVPAAAPKPFLKLQHDTSTKATLLINSYAVRSRSSHAMSLLHPSSS